MERFLTSEHEFTSRSASETFAFGERLGRQVGPGSVLCLYGELGAGKTVLTKGIARGAGVADEREVTSPTFVLVHEHEGRLPIYHLDAYRLHGAEELLDIGIEEYFYGRGICIVEWADRAAAILPADRLDITLHHRGPNERTIVWQAHGPQHARLVELPAPS